MKLTGMVVFKLERERPAMDVCITTASKQVFYYKDRHIRMFDLKTQKDLPIASIRMSHSLGSAIIGLSFHVLDCVVQVVLAPWRPTMYRAQ